MLFVVMTVSCEGGQHKGNGSDNARLECLRLYAVDAYMKESYEKSDSLGRVLYQEAQREENEKYEAYGLLVQGLYPPDPNEAGRRLALVRRAEKMALELDNDTLLSWVYNVLGIYATIYSFNFSEARHYYGEAIKYAKRGNVNHFRISAECNISELYYLFGDTLGLRYDLDILRYSKETRNNPLIVASARRIAEYYIRQKGNEAKALPYISELRNAGNNYLSELVKGKYYHALDSLAEAETAMKAALATNRVTPNFYLSYGHLLNSMGEYRKSNLYLDTAYSSYKKMEEHGFDYIETMRLYSDNMRHLGNDSKALEYLERYIEARDSVNRMRNREEINSYKVKFDVEKKELELLRNHETMRRQRITIWSVGIIGVLCVIFFLIYNYRKKRMHRLIVRQHREFVLQNKVAAETNVPASPNTEAVPDNDATTDTLPAPDTATDSHSSPVSETKKDEDTDASDPDRHSKGGLSKDRSDAIWNAIMHEMDVNHIYTDPGISRDSFSERIGCNHTWFSQVIKERTGKSYLQFMSTRRVSEAVKVLSDPKSDVPIKSLVVDLGFSSISTFYSIFRQQVGMSPAEFRKLSLKESNSVEGE